MGAISTRVLYELPDELFFLASQMGVHFLHQDCSPSSGFAIAELALLCYLVLHFTLEGPYLWCAFGIVILFKYNPNEVLVYRFASLYFLSPKTVAFKLLGKTISGPVD